MKRHPYILCSLVFFTSIAAKKALPLDNDYIKQFEAPEWIRREVDKHISISKNGRLSDLCDKNSGYYVWSCDFLPGYLIKRTVDRIPGREKIHRCIQEKNLTCLTVPKKYYYHIPGKGRELTNENYLVIAEKVKGTTDPFMINLEEVKQICTLIESTGFLDFHGKNILRDTDNKIAILDTENRLVYAKSAGTGYGLKRIFYLKKFNFNTAFTPDALKYIFDRIKISTRVYNDVYNRILTVLEKQPRPLAWDYISYFKGLYPEHQPDN